jgi:hypothetical protein
MALSRGVTDLTPALAVSSLSILVRIRSTTLSILSSLRIHTIFHTSPPLTHHTMRRAITFLALAALVAAHGDHTFDLEDANDEGMSYAERHVSGVLCCAMVCCGVRAAGRRCEDRVPGNGV